MKSKNLLLLFNTVKYLKTTQIYYRLFYHVRSRLRKLRAFENLFSMPSISIQLTLCESMPSNTSFEENKFTFLNKSHYFKNKIDWNYSKYGKLWTYNLTYFDYLYQENITKEEGIKLIIDFIDQSDHITDGLEPFPISLRGINWIKFLTKYNIIDQKINDFLYAQYFILIDKIEYHILGNHLLENGFSLLYGAYYFKNEKFYVKAKKILIDELEEQILKDGAHFELSPMYHQLMLFRLLDCINLVQNNIWKNNELFELMCSKAELMFGWLNVMTFENGNIPLFNDSANKIAPTTKELVDYKKRLHILSDIKHVSLTDSGYRKIKTEYYEMVVDVGNIGPDYIPGHAHSDTFNFELYIYGKPFIVDTGVSTYEANERRQIERSTCSHNTVEVNGENQSHVWGGFRVAERARIIEIREKDGIIKATHNGYKKQGVLHTRSFAYAEDCIVIKDTLEGNSGHTCIAYLHFYPGVNVTTEKNVIQYANATIEFSGCNRILLEEYEYAPEFNSREKAIYAKIFFKNELDMQISVK